MEQRYGFTYRLITTDDPLQGKPLPCSHGPVGGPEHQYITVPWNARDELAPVDPVNTVSLNFGWTFLYGPTTGADVFAHIRIKMAQARCSLHLGLYIVRIQSDGTEVRSPWVCETPERFVGDGETHVGSDGDVTFTATHLDSGWHVPAMAANERLRLNIDYWNVTDPAYDPARIVGGRISGSYWRNV